MLHCRVPEKVVKSLSAHLGRVLVLILIMTVLSPWASAHELAYESELVFSMERMHNHASIITLPHGELFAVWYRGSGEHEANDVKIMGARRNQRAKCWSKPFVLADTPDFPNANPVILLMGRSAYS